MSRSVIRQTVKTVGRPLVCSAAYFGGYCLLTQLLGLGRGARILGYHGINEYSTNAYAVRSRVFAKQMRFLSENFTVISVDALTQLLQAGSSLPPRAVSVTFDDGYLDAYTDAYPILRKYGIPATIFLPVAFIEKKAPQGASRRMAQNRFLSWDQVREMSRNGIDFGSHTMSHFSLTSLSRPEMRYELERSKARLEEEIDKAVTGFAYPYGTVRDYSQEVADHVRAAGYSWAVTGLSGLNQHATSRFLLRRTKVERSDGMYVFKKMLRRALDPWAMMDRLGGLFPREQGQQASS